MWRVLCLTVVLIAGTAQAQTPVKGPATETVTVTGYSQWGVRYATAAEAEAHVRDNDHVYGSLVAAGLGGSHDGRLRSWKVVDVEIRRNPESEHYQFTARTKVEAVIDAWSWNVPKEEDEDDTEEEVWIEDEVERKIAELEDEEKALGKSIEDKLVSDLLDKINDIEVMQNTFVGVLTRLGSKGPALGLWKGGLTADRYVSRLSEMAARVQQVKNSVAGLHDHALGRTQSLLDDFMREFEELDDLFGDELDLVKTYDGKEKEWAAFGHDTFTEYHEARRADRKAYSEAQSEMWQAVHNARMQSIRYDHGMEEEKHARVYRRGRIKDTADTLRWRAQMDRQTSSDTPPPAGEEAADTPQAGLLQKALKKELDQEDLRQALGAEDATETPSPPMRTAARPSPIRAAKADTANSGIRRAGGVEAKGASAIDADGEVLGGGRQNDPTAPRVPTPRPVSAFDLAREGVLRETQRSAITLGTSQELVAFQRSVLEERIERKAVEMGERFFRVLYYEMTSEFKTYEECKKSLGDEWRRQVAVFRTNCDQSRPPYDGGDYAAFKARCPGDWFAQPGQERAFPGSNTSNLRPYGIWYNAQSSEIYDKLKAEFNCGPKPERPIYQAGEPFGVLRSNTSDSSFRRDIRHWLEQVGYKYRIVEIDVATTRENLPKRSFDGTGPMPDLSDAPFTLYENSALKELRDMQKEYQ